MGTEPGKLIGTKFVFSDESRFNFLDHYSRIPVRRYTLRVIFRETAQHKQLLPWLAYLPDMSPIEHVRDLIGRHITRDPRPAASKDDLLLHIQAIWNCLLQTEIQNFFDSMPRRIATFIAARGG
ncbi:transposable element Tcb1 transposase [Trichonephila clavipes]|nr:transposable element Tcb1 transposase [Trichonephila clavipes]